MNFVRAIKLQELSKQTNTPAQAPSHTKKFLATTVRRVWSIIPRYVREHRPLRTAGDWIHKRILNVSERNQSTSTWFLRNRPLLLTIAGLVENHQPGDQVRLCVIGCSTGAEVYSILWTLRKARPDRKILTTAIDISPSAVARAKTGEYSTNDDELRLPLPEEPMRELFDAQGEHLRIKKSFSEGVNWMVADGCDPNIIPSLGLQDIVIANNFLVHMKKDIALSSLRRIAQLVKPSGFLVCRGVDLDIRDAVMRQLGFEPITSRIEEIHEGDVLLDARIFWPWEYWGLEPIDKARKDWPRYYSSIFRAPRY
jgi:SAM-dependent methyltransferase